MPIYALNGKDEMSVKLRLFSLLLVIVLLAVLVPAPVSAASNSTSTKATGKVIETQIRNIYAKCLRGSGRPSFHGYCGSLVSWQLYYLGVDRYRHGGNGNQIYDIYADKSITCGGYKVKAYPVSEYTMEGALNAITANGTMDAYNIMVGFQRTNTDAGKIYGHALLIHAILDGQVYFMESFDCAAPGSRVPQGSPVKCTIEEFCEFYESWTEFEGIIHFGLKSFTPLCTEYPASMSVMTIADTTVYQQPFDEKTYKNVPALVDIAMGERLVVTGLYQTPEGANWYQVEINGQTGYVKPDVVTDISTIEDVVEVSGLELPVVHSKGRKLGVSGKISGGHWGIDNVTVRIYGDTDTPIREAVIEGSGAELDIANKIDSTLETETLKVGSYRITVTAQLSIYEVVDGELIPTIATMELNSSAFAVVDIPRASLRAVESRENWINWLHAGM